MSAELEALRAEVAQLRALMASVAPSPAPEPMVPPIEQPRYAYTPPPTKPFALIAAGPGLRQLSVREVRQLAAAIALCEGELVPGSEVPVAYEAIMKKLAALRAGGSSWRAALTECGLTPPDDDEVLFQARALRDALPGLWDAVAGVMGQLEVRLPGFVFNDLKKTFLRLL